MVEISREFPSSSPRDHLIDALISLSLVNLTVEADPIALEQAQQYIEQCEDNRVIFSPYPHTGHPDSLYVHRAIQTLFPQTEENLLYVSAKDAWRNPLKRLFAHLVTGRMFLFDRFEMDRKKMNQQRHTIAELTRPRWYRGSLSPVIYPQGTRTLGAPLQYLPVRLSQEENIPIAVMNIYGAEQVLPKEEGVTENQQILRKLLERRHKTKDDMIPVTVRLMAFLATEENLPKFKQMFQEAHEDNNG
jgi:hypothetical protein